MKVLIVGGVAGGASAAARLRRLDENAEIILFEKGAHISFANCGLPYHIGGVIPLEQSLLLQTPESFYGRFHVDVRVRNEVTDIDRENKTVTVTNLLNHSTYTETYDKLVLSPGARTSLPKAEGLSLPGVFSLRNVPDAVAINRYIEDNHCTKAVVVGGGNIGIETAENFNAKGIDTTIVEYAPHMIASLDWEMAEIVHTELKNNGLHLMTRTGLREIQKAENGLKVITDQGELAADIVLISTGVVPRNELAVKAGLTTGFKGAIVVNDKMQTSDPDIYAVGDAVEVEEFITGERRNIALAGPANRQGRIAADQIAGIDSRYHGTQSSCIAKVCGLEVACTGINEVTAKAEGYDVEKIYLHSGSHAGYYPGDEKLTVKILFDKKTNKLLGGQFIGQAGADKRCDVLAVAIRSGLKATDLVDLELCYAPPFSSAKDPINMAGFAIENIMTGKVNQFHWEKLPEVNREESFFIDCRTVDEYAQGNVPGFVNIPLHEIRDRLDEIPKDKKIYIHCFSGLRSYVGSRILRQYGYEVYNLSGGWFLYNAAFRK